MAISKSINREEMALFNEQIGFILHSEIHPHNNFCRVAGVAYEELQYEELAPTAHHFTRHLLDIVTKGTLGEILAALLPCPWTYNEIGDYLKQSIELTQDHPYFDWIDFYSTGEIDGLTTRLKRRLDDYALTASEAEKERMKEAFIKSCQLEYMFWEMAYTVEKWPVSV